MRLRLAVKLRATCLVLLALGGFAATAQEARPHRKAGWWQMHSHLPGGKSLVRNLCLDADFDVRNDIFKQPGCTMTVQKVADGYAYKKVCGAATTSGTAIGDFSSTYKITETRGAVQISTEARWMGACPAGRGAGDLWLE